MKDRRLLDCKTPLPLKKKPCALEVPMAVRVSLYLPQSNTLIGFEVILISFEVILISFEVNGEINL